MQPLSEPIQELFSRMKAHAERGIPESGGVTIETHQVVTAAATLYEKIRYLIDYQEEHAIRRSAIERILKRRILIERKRVDALMILSELVEGGYVEQKALSQESLRVIDQSLNKFFRIQPLLPRSKSLERNIISFVAGDIEAALLPSERVRDDAVTEAFYKTIRVRVKGSDPENDIDLQSRCACRRKLLGEDDASLTYALWLLYVPQWRGDGIGLESVLHQSPAVISYIRKHVEDPMQWQIAQKIKNESVYFRIIREFIQRDPIGALELFDNPKRLEAETRAFLAEKYLRESKKSRSSGLRAVGYLLVTKFVLALVVELPYEHYILGGGSNFPLFVNILFHPALLFSLTYYAGTIGKANTDVIVRGMQSVLYAADTRPIYVRGRSRFVKLFAFTYALFALGVFGAMLAVLQALDFNVVSMFLFFSFFVLVSYFAFRIRYNASRWRVITEGPFGLVANMFALPVVRTGHWLSRKFSTVNFFVFLMDFIIETPFKLVLNFSNQFMLYLKEKAAEVR